MRRLLFGLVLGGILLDLVAGDALAQRRFGGPRGRFRGRIGSQEQGTLPADAPPTFRPFRRPFAPEPTPAQPNPAQPNSAQPVPAQPGLGPTMAGSALPPGLIPEPPGEQPAVGLVRGWDDQKERPFTETWYAAHSQVWRVTNPPGTSAYARATASALALWLELPESPSDGPALDRQQSARELATSGAASAEDALWLTLGVFSLHPGGAGPGTRLVQLAVSPEGAVHGAYCDLVTGDVRDVTGAVDKAARRVAWTFAEGDATVFDAPLSELTAARGTLTLHFADGSTGTWSMGQVAQ